MRYFFCGIGGSGMLPLAVLLKQRGHDISGSDRSLDQGKTPEKFKSLENIGIKLHPQDGTGVQSNTDWLVVSSAIEETIPDVKAARKNDIRVIKRGQLLAECFNAAKHKIAIAGTSGKSTVTGMTGTILFGMGQDPTIVNGGEIRNLGGQFPGVRKGRDDLFVAEMDESDGSIDHYIPSVAILNNIALDHKSMEELESLFGSYLARATDYIVINADQPRVMNLIKKIKPKAKILSYSAKGKDAALTASAIECEPSGSNFILNCSGTEINVRLNVPGRHNIENALAALGACHALNLDLKDGAKALEAFKGIHRRLEVIGTANGITVIDDFAHNPDKITATLATLKTFEGRLIVMFQPHGFGPLRLMGNEMVDVFAGHLSKDDILLMPEAYYAGGTVDRSVTAKHLIDNLKAKGIQAHWFETRAEIPTYIQKSARKGDRIIIMGARDDTLHIFAHDLLKELKFIPAYN